MYHLRLRRGEAGIVAEVPDLGVVFEGATLADAIEGAKARAAVVLAPLAPEARPPSAYDQRQDPETLAVLRGEA